ncbi:MAG: LytR C-terminal domain-containing protein [Thermodesulfobacteriota bacterium]
MVEKQPAKAPQSKVSFWSKFGLQAAMIAILGLAGPSFLTLGFINRSKKPEPPPPKVETKISRAIKPPEAAAVQPAAPTQPPPAAGGSDLDNLFLTPAKTVSNEAAAKEKPPVETAAKVESPAPKAKNDAGAKETFSPSPAAKTSGSGRPTAAESSAKPPAGGTEKQEKPSSVTAKNVPAPSPPEKPAAGPSGQAGAAQEKPKPTSPTAEKPSSPQAHEAAKTPAKPEQPGPAKAQTNETPSPGEARAKAPFPPPAGQTAKEEGPSVPKPQWQTLDQNWDKVTAGGAPGVENLGSGGAAWRQMDIGQTQASKPETKVPTPAAASSAPGAPKSATAPGTPPTSASTRDKTAKSAAPIQTPPAAKPQAGIVSTPPAAKARPTWTRVRSSPAKPAAPGERLVIINESGRPGLAEVYRDVLKAMGYQVVRTEERVPQPGPTTVLYGPGQEDKARTLLSRLPGQRTMTPSTQDSAREMFILVR